MLKSKYALLFNLEIICSCLILWTFNVRRTFKDCGLFTIAYATDLVCGEDPCLSHFQHEAISLVNCLEKGFLQCFLLKKLWRVGLGNCVKKNVKEKISSSILWYSASAECQMRRTSPWLCVMHVLSGTTTNVWKNPSHKTPKISEVCISLEMNRRL